jgi:heme oxygenase
LIRKPILTIIDKVSSRFIPSSHTPEEAAYLDAYATAMEDFIITKEERKLLKTVAATFGLNDKIVKQLESEYDLSLEEE